MLDKFLQGRIRALSVAGTVTPAARVQSKPNKTRAHHTASTQRSANSSVSTQQPKYICGNCKSNHLISFCEEFRRMSPAERRRTAAEKALCFICLATGHKARMCRSTRVFQTCNLKHNTMLHLPEDTITEQQQVVQAPY